MKLLTLWISGLLVTMFVGTFLFSLVLILTTNVQAALTVAGATGLIGGFSFAYAERRKGR